MNNVGAVYIDGSIPVLFFQNFPNKKKYEHFTETNYTFKKCISVVIPIYSQIFHKPCIA